MTIPASPLQWPQGWKRTDPGRRADADFGRVATTYSGNTSFKRRRELTIAEAVQRVRDELRRFGIRDDDLVINSNLKLRLDGMPMSDQRQPDDPGVAVYWREVVGPGANRVMAIDRYRKVQDNLAAIAATIEAMRAIERHGGAVILERAFTGFTALPAPGQGVKRDWWVVLEVDRATVTREGCKGAYRRLATLYHPDKPGGSHEAMAELNAAHDQALKEIVR